MQLLTSLVAVNSVNATPRLYLYSYIVSLLVKELETVEPHYETLYLLIVALSKTLVEAVGFEPLCDSADVKC